MFKYLAITLSLMSSVSFAEVGLIKEIIVTNTATETNKFSKPVIIELNNGDRYIFCGIVATNYIEQATNLLTMAMLANKKVELTLNSNRCVDSVSVRQ